MSSTLDALPAACETASKLGAEATTGQPMRKVPRLRSLCAEIEQILLGERAAQFETGRIPDDSTLLILPSWTWVLPRIDVGPKNVQPHPMPTRIDWDGGPLIGLNARPAARAWRVHGLGHDFRGTATIQKNAQGYALGNYPDQAAPPEPIAATTPNELRRALRRIVDAGTTARWRLMSQLEWWAAEKLRRANEFVAGEIHAFTNTTDGVLDQRTLEALLTRMTLGDPGATSSALSRLVDRCLIPESFARVDPLRYVTSNIRRSAEDEIRRAIGDPHVGRKVRRVARAEQPSSLEEMVRVYREYYPKDGLDRKRAEAALTAGATLDVSALPLAPFDDGKAQRSVTYIESGFDRVDARLDAEGIA